MNIIDQLAGMSSPSACLRLGIRCYERGEWSKAFQFLARAAKAELMEAEYLVGRCYLDGSGVPVSRREATRWLERAAAHGSAEAQVLVAVMWLQGVAVADDPAADLASPVTDRIEASEPDFRAAYKWAQMAAQGGSAEGQALLGYILASGPDEMRDEDEAFRWYERSAAKKCPQGHLGFALLLVRRPGSAETESQIVRHLTAAASAELASAMYLLGRFLEQGCWVRRDPERAAKLFKRAAEKGHPAAQFQWALRLMSDEFGEQDRAEAETWLRRAASSGHPEAAVRLAELYLRGSMAPPNYYEAAQWYRIAAEKGDLRAARALGSLYLTGRGVARDEQAASHWLGLAARSGDAASQAEYASLVLQGFGQASDQSEVASWFASEAKAGDLVAAFNIAVCLAKGVGVLKDELTAAQWLRRAAEGGPEAQYVYARFLAEGRGVPPDLEGAREWFGRAAAAGHADAQVALGEMMLNGRGGQRSVWSALEQFKMAAGQSHSGAMFALGALFAGGYGVPADLPLARHWLGRAAKCGHLEAQRSLGRLALDEAANEERAGRDLDWLARISAQK